MEENEMLHEELLRAKIAKEEMERQLMEKQLLEIESKRQLREGIARGFAVFFRGFAVFLISIAILFALGVSIGSLVESVWYPDNPDDPVFARVEFVAGIVGCVIVYYAARWEIKLIRKWFFKHK